ncbi:GPW/gp25 family protein [Caballeronia telluris]|uniref:GPW/gp25 family protein n=1 Tax=Caballeronia telluris TaxID=326475 RepID=A0A158K0J9_9BURK|nr:GPW/gp25 family protein [Caballeronia telluris]
MHCIDDPLHDLRNQMENTLLKLEPRLRAVEIEIDERPKPGLLVSFIMTCHPRMG